MDKPRTIVVEEKTKILMDESKVVASETYDSVIDRLLKLQKIKVMDAKKQKMIS